MKRFFAVTMVIIVLGCAKTRMIPPPNPTGNPSEDIVQCAKWAHQNSKVVLLYFRGDWCDYCKQLDRVLLREDVLSILDHYVQLRFDVGNFDQNMDIFEQYMGKDTRGVPALAILKKDGTTKVSVTGEKWGESDQAVYDYIKPFLEKNAKS